MLGTTGASKVVFQKRHPGAALAVKSAASSVMLAFAPICPLKSSVSVLNRDVAMPNAGILARASGLDYKLVGTSPVG